jgi:hypothetical protein
MGKKDNINSFWMLCSLALAGSMGLAFQSFWVAMIVLVGVVGVLVNGRHIR